MMTARQDSEEMLIGGRYRVIRTLATGGMGTVYEAENTRTLRRVAIKTIRPEVAERASVVERFEREAQAAGQLRHPNIIDVLDLGDDPAHQMLFIVEEFLVGGDLGACLRAAGTLSPRAALATLLPILDALTLAHGHGVVHRDLKPDNIFLHETPQGVVPKLIDFGVAKLAGAAFEQRRASTGSLVGSPIYMSPEQARADVTIDARTDVWSMGVVFYEALTGSTPFDGQSPFELFTKIASDEPIALATLGPDLPADLVAVVQRAVTKDREARWPTMAAFAMALRSCEAWRDVDPLRAARWVVNAAGASAADEPTHQARELAERATLDMIDPGPTVTVDSDRHGSGHWTSEVTPEAFHAAATPTRWSRLLGATALVAAIVVGVVVSTREHAAPPQPSHVASVPITAPVAAPVAPPVAAPAPAPTLITEPELITEPAVEPVADAGVARAPVVRAPVRRRVIRRAPARPAAPAATPTVTAPPPVIRGFNGAPIVD